MANRFPRAPLVTNKFLGSKNAELPCRLGHISIAKYPSMKLAKLVGCLIFAGLGVGASQALSAGPVNDKVLADVQSKIQQIGGDVRELQAEKNRAVERLQKLELQYG